MRVNELDSVRGIAAFIVVLHHLWETILPDQNTYPFLGNPIAGTGPLADVALWISLSPLRLLFSGHAAVGVFFVLSGFALTKSLENARQKDFVPFMIRRFFRIYPPFALIIFATVFLCLIIQPQPVPYREWINLSWNHPLSVNLVLGHLAMIATSGQYVSMNSPMWTLVHELRISLVFVFMAPLVAAYPRSACVAAVTTFSLFSIRHFTTLLAGFIPDGLSREIFMSFIQTCRYLLFFVIGILIASKPLFFTALLERTKNRKGVLWLIAFILLAVPYATGYLEFCYAIGAALLIVLCINSMAARQFLNKSPLLWMGKISYSLYLSHQILLITLVHVLHDKLPIGIILFIVLITCLPLADFLNRTIELPSSELGKRMANRVLAKR